MNHPREDSTKARIRRVSSLDHQSLREHGWSAGAASAPVQVRGRPQTFHHPPLPRRHPAITRLRE
jgi:hypothetical protein